MQESECAHRILLIYKVMDHWINVFNDYKNRKERT